MYVKNSKYSKSRELLKNLFSGFLSYGDYYDLLPSCIVHVTWESRRPDSHKEICWVVWWFPSVTVLQLDLSKPKALGEHRGKVEFWLELCLQVQCHTDLYKTPLSWKRIRIFLQNIVHWTWFQKSGETRNGSTRFLQQMLEETFRTGIPLSQRH